jgi:hypothetical protein
MNCWKESWSILSETLAEYSLNATPVPEPSAEMLLGGGILLLGFGGRWRKS